MHSSDIELTEPGQLAGHGKLEPLIDRIFLFAEVNKALSFGGTRRA